MEFSRKLLAATILLSFILSLGACASHFIDVRPGSEQVSVAQPNQIVNCATKGKLTVSVLNRIGFFTRSVEAVEANLLQLARNGATDAGVDTVVKQDSAKYGERTFAIYKCRP